MRARFAVVASLILAQMIAFAGESQGQNNKAPYPSMAPLEQYLMDRDAEISLARSAAPAAISSEATVLVFGRKGYETAVRGKNGFACLVERSWTSLTDNDPEFWNPKDRFPICYNSTAARFLLPLTVKKTEMALAGLSQAQIIAGSRHSARKNCRPWNPARCPT
jgi:hypothetical protein